ncbi:MFS transporter [[Eubacterium] cellulosolvens]
MYSKDERTALIGLGMPLIFLRFGKALVILIFITYGLNFTDSLLLIGIAFGATAFVQAMFTIPFGFWSDRFGRKKMIVIGLISFIIGSFLAAHPFDNIFILILARSLQGLGAIYACVLAFIGDVIPDSKRSRTLAFFSISTGTIYSLGIILGPTLSPVFLPYSFLFIIPAVLAIGALGYLMIFIDEPQVKTKKIKMTSNKRIFKDALKNKDLLITYFSTFFSNFITISILFIFIPIVLGGYLPSGLTGLVLIPIFIFSMIVMFFTSKIADKGKRKPISLLGFILIGGGLSIFYFSDLFLIILGLIIFFTGMAILDPILPSFVIKIASKKSKGTASGFYDISRYLGEAIGSMMAGLLLVFAINYLLSLLIILVILGIILIINLNVNTYG